jgi:hypothetical protein
MRRSAVAVFGAGLLCALVWWVTQRGASPEPGAMIPSRDTSHPILLIVDSESILASRPQSALDRWHDLEWTNLLTQGYGGCDVATSADAIDHLANRQLVVVPRRTAGTLPGPLLEELESRVQQGLQVLVEAPDSALCRQFGLELATVERRPRLPWPEPVASGTRRPLAIRPQPVDVPWTRFRYAPAAAAPDDRPRVHLSLDGRPMGWSYQRGEGAWLVLAFDFAELSSRLRQRGEQGALLEGQDYAWLDAWIEGLCGSAMTALPLARVAAAPPDADGWLVLSPSPSSGPSESTLEPGFAFGTGLPSRALGRTGRLLPAWELPLLYRGAGDGLEPARLDRWARHNAAGGAGALQLELHGAPGGELSRELAALPARRGHVDVAASDLLAWWLARQDLRVRVSAEAGTVDYLIESVPESVAGFGLLVPVRWRDRSLEGWDADWGFAPGRRVQRYDRAYRVIELPPEAAGSRLRLRYR